MTPGLFILLMLLAIGIGFLASLFGIGGGFLLVPTMIMIVGLDTHMTVGTVSLVITFMALSSSIAYAKQKRIDYKVTGILMAASIIGSVIGAWVTTLVTGQLILILFGTIEATLAVILGLKKTPAEKQKLKEKLELKNRDSKSDNSDESKKTDNQAELEKKMEIQDNVSAKKWYILDRTKTDSDGNTYKYQANLLIAFPFCLLAGFLSSLLGIGGGTLYIQIFIFLCGMSIHMAIASSMFTIFISGISSTIAFASIGQIDYIVAIAYSIGMIVGAQLGAIVSKKIKSKHLKPMAAIMIIIIAVRMIYFAVLENPV
jgi:uncharacterized protein